jgi:hypothetical protein
MDVNNIKDKAANIVSRSAVSPTTIIAPTGYWTTKTYMYLIFYWVIFLICFMLSLSSYREDDPTPYGHRFLYALSAGLWNILYLFYYALLRF